MEKETFEGKWQQMKGDIQKKWGKLTDDEIQQTKGDYEKLMGTIKEKYGNSKENVKEEVNKFIRDFKNNSDSSKH